jgi:hypothetical protein
LRTDEVDAGVESLLGVLGMANHLKRKPAMFVSQGWGVDSLTFMIRMPAL